MSLKKLAAILCFFPVLAGAADTPKLDILMGLWEDKSTTTTTGEAGIPASAQKKMDEGMKEMSPEQRAQMEMIRKQMTQHQGEPRVHNDRSCWTKAKLDRVGYFGREDKNGECTDSITQNDSRKMVVSMACSNKDSSGKGQLVFNAISPTHVTGTMDMAMIIGGKPVNMHTDVVSTWISADCGSVK